MGKSWDTKKVSDFIECFEHATHNYIEHLGDVHRSYEDYTSNETFVGQAADSTKTFITLKQKEFNRQQYELSKEMVKRYTDLDETFKAIVDPAADARINTDVVSKVKTHFMNQYDYLEHIGCKVQQKTIEAVGRLGKYGCDLEEINFKDTIMQYYDYCGTGGFLDNCIKKVEEFDDTAYTRIFNSGIRNAIQEHIEEVSDKAAGLDMIHTQAVDINKQTLSLVSLSTAAINACTNTVSKTTNNRNSPAVSPEIKMLMDEFGFTEKEAELLNKAINALDDSALILTKDPYKRMEHIYGTLSALCISYDATRWRATTGQKTLRGAILDLKFAGMTDQEILDLQVLINLQHGDFTDERLKIDGGIDISKSSFSKETHAAMERRMNGNINDFSHTTVQLAAFAHGDDMYKNKSISPVRYAVDLFNSPTNSQFNSTMTRYEISFKGDIDSGHYSEEDFKSDIDAINIYKRMIEDGDVKLGTWISYYDDVNSNSKVRATEFFENMGDGDVGIGVINTKNVIEEKTRGSDWIIKSNETDIHTARSVFMQWILSVYEGVEYDFPKSN
jgi:hypothetical protein